MTATLLKHVAVKTTKRRLAETIKIETIGAAGVQRTAMKTIIAKGNWISSVT